MAPCAPGNQMCPPGPFGQNAPQFHVRDLSCGENDPNGPVYDPVHGVYHLHYQNHVGCRGGRTYVRAAVRPGALYHPTFRRPTPFDLISITTRR
eukprot:5608069-Prymnesium_polylepis.2